MEVERLWGEKPGWLATLDADMRRLLLGHYARLVDPAGPSKRKRRKRGEMPVPVTLSRSQQGG